MSELALKINSVSKLYRLGQVGTGTLSHDLNRWWAKIRGKEDPRSSVGVVNDREQYGDEFVWVLKNINFEVKKGEIVGIIGRNGAGKSTLLKLLSRVTGPTKGGIHINGRIASLLEVGTGFHPELTGRENIYLNGAILGMTKREINASFEEIVEFSGCAKYIDTPVKRYSSGMHVRLAFAVAAHLETDILIIDEVLAVGDAEFQKKCIGKLQDLGNKSNRTILFVSHNMTVIQSLCERGIVLHNGEVKFDGGQEEAINYYVGQNSTAHLQKLSDRTDRQGIGRLKAVSASVINEHGNACTELVSGGYYNFSVTFSGDQDMKNFNVSIAIFDAMNNILTDLATQSAGFLLKDPQDSFTVECEILRMPLNVGRYSFSIYCSLDEELQDHIEFAGFFDVIGGDYFKGGALPSPNSGPLLIEHQWRLKGD